MKLRNWSGTYQFTAQKVVAARGIDEVQRVVAAGGRVRGARHQALVQRPGRQRRHAGLGDRHRP